MNLFIKIKKIISSILFLCVLVSVIPVQIFAQTTPANMSAFAGWDQVKSTNVRYKDNEDSPFTTTGATNIKLNNYTYEILQKESPTALTNPSGGTYEQSKLYMISDGKSTSIYYKPYSGENNADTVLISHVTKNGNKDTFYFPPAGFVGKSSDQENPASKNLSTERGFINAIDAANNRPAETYLNLVYVDRIKDLYQQQQNTNTDIAKLEQTLASGQENEVAVTPERKVELEKLLADKVANQTATAQRLKQAEESTKSKKIDTGSCPSNVLEIGKFFTSPDCVITLLAIVANAVLKMSALVLYWTGNLFDYSIEIAVNSAEFLKKLGIVEPTWAFVRDALNMTFIFILLFVAVQILLGKGGYTAKGSIARLVLVAILMNFSLFAAKAMVDVSNIISLNVYEAIKTKEAGQNRGNVSARIMTTLGLSGIYNFGAIFDGNAIPGCGGAPGTILTVGVFGTILIIVTALTFLLAAILFFLRMLNIIVLFITSPVWIWGYVMENNWFKSKTTWWMNNMWHTMKFPVIFMVMLYVSLAMFAQLNTAQRTSGGESVSFIKLICDSANNLDSNVLDKLPLILNFILVIAMLMGIIAYSAKHSGSADVLGTGKLATNFSNKIDNLQKKFTTGAAQGVYNKSRDAVVGVGSGTLEIGKKAKDATLTLAKDIGRAAGNNVSNRAANKLGSMATGSFTNMPKVQTALAMMSNKLKDQKFFNETEKEAEERRTKGTKKRAETLAKVQKDHLKVESFNKWVKENPEGKPEEYKEYLRQKAKLRFKTQLGGLESVSMGKDENGNEITTEDSVYDKIFVSDGKGGEKLDEEILLKNIKKAKEYHEEKGNLLKAENSKRWGIFKGERSKTRLKVRENTLDKALSEARNKKTGKAEKIKSSRELLDRLPVNFEDINESEKKKYNGIIVSYISERDAIIKKRDQLLGSAKESGEIKRIKDKAESELLDLKIKTKDKVVEERNKLDNNIAKLEKELETEEEKKKEKEKNKDKDK